MLWEGRAPSTAPPRIRHPGHVSDRALHLPPLPLPSHQTQLFSLNGELGAGGASAGHLPVPSPLEPEDGA